MVTGDQATQVGAINLDQFSIADAVNRQKISDKRKRNEMMRLGTSDPNAFAVQNQQQLQEATMPSQFYGAGRKEASNQNPDVDAANMVGGIQKLGDMFYYYGDKDTSTAKFGVDGYNLKDTGKFGRRDIYDQQGNNLGEYFMSSKDALGDYYFNQQKGKAFQGLKPASKPTYDYEGRMVSGPKQDSRNYWQHGMLGGQFFNTQDDLNKALRTAIGSGFTHNDYYGRPLSNVSDLEYSKVLEDLLSGKDPTRMVAYGQSMGVTTPATGWRDFGGTHGYGQTTGLNALFNSKPLIWDGKLQGYAVDTAAAKPGDYGYSNPYTLQTIDANGGTRSQAYLQRNILNPEKWQQIGRGMSNGDVFVKTENINSIPGWSTQNYVNVQSKPDNGLFGGIFDFLDPILDSTLIEHDWTQENVRQLLGKDTQKETFQTVAPAVLGMVLPGYWGAALSGLDAASRGDDAGVLAAAAGAAVGASGVGGSLSSTLQSSANLSPTVANAVSSAVTNAAVNMAANGGDMKSALSSAIFGSLSGAAGNYLSNATSGYLGDVGSKILGGAASGGLNSLFSKNSPVQGSLFGGISGGLHGWLNSVNRASDSLTPKQDSQNKLKAQQLSQLFRKVAGRGK